MALNSRTLNLLGELRRRGAINGRRIADIGAQQLSDSFLADIDGIQRTCAAFGAVVPALPAPLAPGEPGLRADAPPARLFYEAIGAEYVAIDVDGSPGAVALDLNVDSVPRNRRRRFDIVTNLGTTEHVANQLNAFRIIHDLTARGGVMVHELPAQGYINHGFFTYNPRFFWLLSRDNDYEWLTFDFGWTEAVSHVHQDVLAEMRRLGEISRAIEPFERPPYAVSDGYVLVVLRKRSNRRFQLPVDADPGSIAPTRAIQRRYPRVFRAPR